MFFFKLPKDSYTYAKLDVLSCFFFLTISTVKWQLHICQTIVFKPGPVQGPSFGFWPGHRVSRVNLYLKKNSKRRRFSKKKVNGLQSGFARSPGQPARSAESYRVMTFPIFSSTQPSSSPGSAGSWVGPPGRAGFKNYVPNQMCCHICFQLPKGSYTSAKPDVYLLHLAIVPFEANFQQIHFFLFF